MNILHITQSLDEGWGGIARVLPMLAGELNRVGDHGRIAVLKGDRFGTPQNPPDVEVLAFAANAGSRLGLSREFDRRITELVKESDVVHLHGLWAGQNWSAGKAARQIGRPIIMTPHSMMMPWAWNRSRWKKRPIGWLFEHKNLRTSACLHALAKGEAEYIRGLGFNPNVEIIANGIHPAEFEALPAAEGLEARFPAARGKKWVLFLGRIAVQKGIIPAMKGSFDVLAANEEWHGVIAGPDEFGIRKMLEAAATRKGMKDRLTFTGMLSREEVLACLGRSSVLLQPSLSEGLSMSILEALASGLPVIISHACNMPEVKADDAGRIVEPDRRGVAAAMREIVGMSDEDRAALGENGRRLVRSRFDWRKLISDYQAMYRRAAGA